MGSEFILKAGLMFIVAGAVSFIGTPFLLSFLIKKNIMDVPNSRSSHTHPTPRGGGLAILAGILIGSWASHWALGFAMPLAFYAGLLLVALAGLIDDVIKNSPVLFRLILHFLAAILVVIFIGTMPELPLPSPLNIQLGIWGFPLTVLWVVALINIYNFMDGIDGFAGVQGILGGVGLVLMGGPPLQLLGVIIIGACIGFLPYNWHPAKIFMGDVGSGMLGYLFAASAMYPSEKSSLQIAMMVFCLWFFISDSLYTIVRRLLRGEKIWTAHRTHLYQRLVVAGWRHDRVVQLAGGLGVMLIAVVFFMAQKFSSPTNWASFACAALFSVFYLVLVTRAEQNNKGLKI